MLNIQNAHIQNDEYVHFVYTLILSLWIPHISFVFIGRHALMLLKNIAEISVIIISYQLAYFMNLIAILKQLFCFLYAQVCKILHIRGSYFCLKKNTCNDVQREHNKKLNNGLPILHKVPPKRDYGRYFCIMAEKGGTSHGGLTEKLSLFFHAKKQEVNAYGR